MTGPRPRQSSAEEAPNQEAPKSYRRIRAYPTFDTRDTHILAYILIVLMQALARTLLLMRTEPGGSAPRRRVSSQNLTRRPSPHLGLCHSRLED